VEPFVIVPLGGDDSFAGEGTPAGGFWVVFDSQWLERLILTLNSGFEFRGEKVATNGIDFQNRWMNRVGLAVPVTGSVSTSAELAFATALEHFFSDRASTPAEATVGLRWRPGPWSLSLGGGTCLVCGTKAGRAHALLSVGYTLAHPIPEVFYWWID
jgi:hypothetical protein